MIKSRRRRTGAIAVIPIAAVILGVVHACGGPVVVCAATSPTPALRTAVPADVLATSRPSRTRTTGPKASRSTTAKPPKQYPSTWGAWGRHHDDDDCDDDD